MKEKMIILLEFLFQPVCIMPTILLPISLIGLIVEASRGNTDGIVGCSSMLFAIAFTYSWAYAMLDD